MRHPRYCLTHHLGISCNITNATPFSMPPMPPTLARRLLYPCWCTTHAGTSAQHASYVTHTSMSTTLAHHSRQHTTKANTLPMLACLPPMHASHVNHTSTNRTLFLKLLGKLLKYLVFIFTAFTFQAFLSIKGRLFFSKTNAQILEKTFFQKKPFYIF